MINRTLSAGSPLTVQLSSVLSRAGEPDTGLRCQPPAGSITQGLEVPHANQQYRGPGILSRR